MPRPLGGELHLNIRLRLSNTSSEKVVVFRVAELPGMDSVARNNMLLSFNGFSDIQILESISSRNEPGPMEPEFGKNDYSTKFSLEAK
jgi:hypothetical protein